MAEDRERVEVLVIGAGAAGAAFTWSLSQAGIKVMCLEQGRWMDPSPTPRGWTIGNCTASTPIIPTQIFGLPADYPVNDTASPIAPLMYNAVGGSTIYWSAISHALNPRTSACARWMGSGRLAADVCAT